MHIKFAYIDNWCGLHEEVDLRFSKNTLVNLSERKNKFLPPCSLSVALLSLSLITVFFPLVCSSMTLTRRLVLKLWTSWTRLVRRRASLRLWSCSSRTSRTSGRKGLHYSRGFSLSNEATRSCQGWDISIGPLICGLR